MGSYVPAGEAGQPPPCPLPREPACSTQAAPSALPSCLLAGVTEFSQRTPGKHLPQSGRPPFLCFASARSAGARTHDEGATCSPPGRGPGLRRWAAQPCGHGPALQPALCSPAPRGSHSWWITSSRRPPRRRPPHPGHATWPQAPLAAAAVAAAAASCPFAPHDMHPPPCARPRWPCSAPGRAGGPQDVPPLLCSGGGDP